MKQELFKTGLTSYNDVSYNVIVYDRRGTAVLVKVAYSRQALSDCLAICHLMILPSYTINIYENHHSVLRTLTMALVSFNKAKPLP